MPRRPRVVLPGFPHHVTQRGNGGTTTFRAHRDFTLFLSMLEKYCTQYAIQIWSYCLMSNHYHLIARPDSKKGLSRCLHDLNGCYAQYFNRRFSSAGHLWQERFFSCSLDTSHLWNAIRCVEQNPVRAGLVQKAEDYRWSSAAARCGLRRDRLLAASDLFLPSGLIQNWSHWLGEYPTEEDLDAIREATRRGTVHGTEAFVDQLESWLGIPLRPLRRGPKPALK